ncbi:hypothetical protein POV27_08500 [Aureisphaera galaxeae]|uniref:hypothetical protein n=1 Tax=Aureisphaera galaxeae TaxID=1538023 RepID=UPI00234FF8A1|nr:hypothetical protein [Aureisphaera galaxeae]MDC8004091.1 hypothetical protein [Aureisphaera galaxeae]
MNFDLEDKLSEYVKKGDLDTAIEIAESELKKVSKTDFHALIGKDLLHLAPELSTFISNFYSAVKLRYAIKFSKKLKALYCEMNGFTINYDRWFVDIFAYSDIDENDYDWLADYDFLSKRDMTIKGFESFQKVYEDVHKYQKFDIPEIEQAYDIAELIIILRLQELFRKTYKKAERKGLKWSSIPMFVTAHDYEMMYRIN